MASRAYKTLPSTFRKEDSPHPVQDHQPHNRSFGPLSSSSSSSRTPSSSSSSEGRLFGLNLHLGISNLISGGMNFLGQLRRKTPLSAPTVSSSPTLSFERPLLSTTEFSLLSTSSAPTNASYCDSGRTDYSATEVIEMSSFAVVPLAEGEHEEQTGLGHQFIQITTFNPTWCDLCRDLIWGLYDTGGTRCTHCDLTCHEKCRQDILLNCTSYERGLTIVASRRGSSSSSSSSSTTDVKTEDESTLANISTIRDEELLNNEECDGYDDEDVRTLKNPALEELSPDGPDPEPSYLVDEVSQDLSDSSPNFLEKIPPDLLKLAVEEHNKEFPTGQETVYNDGDNFHGFIRVQLNLRRPINVLPGTRPPSVYTITSRSQLNNNHTAKSDSGTGTGTSKDRTLTSFYLPCDTVKVLHVEADTTTADVIRNLLKKFRVVDNPHKFALYVKRPGEIGKGTDTIRSITDGGSMHHQQNTLGRVRMRRLNDGEHPLLLALSWRVVHLTNPTLEGGSNLNNVFVLQENDPGEIIWESFSFPELKNFLRILDREEAWYKKRIHEKYDFLHHYMQDLINKKKEEMAAETTKHKS